MYLDSRPRISGLVGMYFVLFRLDSDEKEPFSSVKTTKSIEIELDNRFLSVDSSYRLVNKLLTE